MSVEKWNAQYKSGAWDVLKSAQEVERYLNLAHLIDTYLPTNGCILDIGCGEDILLSYLNDIKYSKYVGIDFSEVAISRCKNLENQCIEFIVADMCTYIPEINFDIIIFNESLYYSPNPLELIKSYFRWLNKDGKIIVSIFQDVWNLQILHKLQSVLSSVKNISIKNDRGTWNILVYNSESFTNS